MEEKEETEISVVTTTLDLRIQDFFRDTKEVCEYQSKNFKNCPIYFSATVSPNGIEQDWLSVQVQVVVYSDRSIVEVMQLKWAVSIIDIEGRTRFTRYYENPQYLNKITYINQLRSESESLPHVFLKNSRDENLPPELKLPKESYLKKSFILNRADEFLSNGTLLLSCTIYLDFDSIKHILVSEGVMLSDTLSMFMHSIPQSVIYNHDPVTGYCRETCTVFDFTTQVLSLPQFHEARKRFDVYGISPELSNPGLETKQDISNILEHVWIFDTCPDRFLLSLERHSGNVGRLLVNASPVIRRCVNANMKEQREKRVVFPNVDSRVFKIVLHFLKTGDIFKHTNVIEEVYKFSHLYEMEILQRKCAEYITFYSATKDELEEIEKLADLYSDDYHLRMLLARKRKVLDSKIFLEDDWPNFDCYI